MVKVKVKKIDEKAVLPEYGTEKSACLDLYLSKDLCVGPGETSLAHTGIACEPPSGYVGLIFARSGLATKQGLRLANSVGVIDEDYRGEYLVAIHNDSNEARMLNRGVRIAQLLFLPYDRVLLEEVQSIDETARGEGGFGSTGIN